MSYRNTLMNELMVPRSADVARRIHGFFDAIGWDVRNNSKTEFEVLASPDVGAYLAPTIAYWLTENPKKTGYFIDNPEPAPSEYTQGVRLPHLFELVEICMIVPTDDHVHDIFGRGGKVLQAHAHTPPREHVGRQEFRFSDPFNYAIRVTADPGYEVNMSDEPLVGRRLDHVEGTSYEVDEVILRAAGYERDGQLTREVIYTQHVAGDFPAGTRYSRPEAELLHGTVHVDDQEVPIFQIHDA